MLREITFFALIIINLFIYVHYINSIREKKNTPHVFSWIIWLLTCSITFAGQITKGGGLGAYITLQSAIITVIIIFFSAKNASSQQITKKDWASLFFCLGAILLWIITSDPKYCLILVWLVYMVGFIPTFLKNHKNPHEDSLGLYLFWAVKNYIAYLLLQEVYLETALYPLGTSAVSALLIFMTLIRRQKVQKSYLNRERDV